MEKKYVILYVDDEEANLRIFNSTFRREFTVITAISAEEGITILKEKDVDIVITDQRMPNKSGVEFLKEINTMFPKIPPNRLMISAFAKNAEIDEAFENYRLFTFIQKPWKEAELRKIIITAIETK
jgi:response regulator RpfG family c-di-GMP phosphodiesterase